MSKKQRPIPDGVMHEPSVMAWAEVTPLSEHKEREAAGVEVKVVPYNGTRREPLPLSRATTELRRAYPYLFDCAAYAKTHNPEKIESDEFYTRLTMPYHKFLDYCLDDCDEQTQYLKEEIYKLIKGQPAKYIKVSEHTTVYAQPIIIAFKHTELKTGKDKRITNIGQDAKVDRVQVQILNELLDVSHGYLNIPKSFYAKIRHAYNRLRENLKPFLDCKNGYLARTNLTKSRAQEPITTEVAEQQANTIIDQANALEKLEQGGFYSVYLAFEYIIARKKKGIKTQQYDLLELCEKCTPELVHTEDGILRFRNLRGAYRFILIVAAIVSELPLEARKIIGIQGIMTYTLPDTGKITVNFY